MVPIYVLFLFLSFIVGSKSNQNHRFRFQIWFQFQFLEPRTELYGLSSCLVQNHRTIHPIWFWTDSVLVQLKLGLGLSLPRDNKQFSIRICGWYKNRAWYNSNVAPLRQTTVRVMELMEQHVKATYIDPVPHWREPHVLHTPFLIYE